MSQMSAAKTYSHSNCD